MRRRLKFQAPFTSEILYLGGMAIIHYHVQMILVKTKRLKFYAGHTSKQLRQYTSQLLTKSKVQDPTAVFTHTNHMILKSIGTIMGSTVKFHPSIISPPGSFIHWCNRGVLSSTA